MISGKWIALSLVLVTAVSMSAADSAGTTNSQDFASYAIGADVARNLRRDGIGFDAEQVVQGLRDAAAGRKLAISEVELRRLVTKVQNEQRIRMARNRGKPTADVYRRIGSEFLEANKTREGVVCLPTGLQYKILNSGNGAKPKDTDTVAFNYRTTGLDGTEYNCSNKGQPGVFKLSEVEVPGWREALRLMPIGSRWQLFIPSDLAYGVQGVGRTIGPNETLVSELELIAIR